MQIRDSIASFGDRYLHRVYLDSEIESCGQAGQPDPARLAARFAAKEAVLKALDLAETGTSWRDIEVHRWDSGKCTIRLRGKLARSLDFKESTDYPVSLSHDGAYAIAVVAFPAAIAPTAQSIIQTEHPVTTNDQITTTIRKVLAEHARLTVDAETIEDDKDLYQAGMTSHSSVNVMLALEGAFDVEFPDHMLKRSVFSSVAAVRQAVLELTS